jgi:GH24 family phage-related lysozyme (muramidase)
VELFIADLGNWEGTVDHMYLDTRGNVTVGVGKLLPDAASAEALPFRHRTTGILATAEEIGVEFEHIQGIEMPDCAIAGYYEPFTRLYLSQSDIDGLALKHLRADFRALLRQYPDFGNFPLPAQIALLDMLYNLGPPVMSSYSNMRRAIHAADWEAAARQSARSGISDERNQHVFNLFMEAARN